jgi:hypothetical protein
MKRIGRGYLEGVLSDDKPSPVYPCSSCGKIGFALNHKELKGHRFGECEVCRICGLDCNYAGMHTAYSKKEVSLWRKAWKECGAISFYELPFEKRIDYYDEVYEAFFRKQYFVLSDEDRENRKLDDRLFTENGHVYPFISDKNKRVVISCESGEKWTFEYETNKILYLDDDKRYILLVRSVYETIVLASKSLGGLGDSKSIMMGFPGLKPDLFAFVGAFMPKCLLKDTEGKEYIVEIITKANPNSSEAFRKLEEGIEELNRVEPYKVYKADDPELAKYNEKFRDVFGQLAELEKKKLIETDPDRKTIGYLMKKEKNKEIELGYVLDFWETGYPSKRYVLTYRSSFAMNRTAVSPSVIREEI